MIITNDILLDYEDDLLIVNGDFAVGESILQEVGIILRLTTGDLKSDPLMAPNLLQLIKGKSDNEFEDRVRLFLKRDNKKYEELKRFITLNRVV